MLTTKNMLAILLLLAIAASSYSQEYFHAENYGGKQQLKDFIKQELVYPQTALDDKIEGTVVLDFRVKQDGSITNLKVENSVNPELDAEAIRVFNYVLWDPAIYRGMKLEEDGNVEIQFKVKKYQRCVKSRGYSQIEYPYEPVDKSLRIYECNQLNASPRPQYDNRDMSFNQFLLSNLAYPQSAQKQGISGTVEMFFVVEPTGRISNVKILKPVGAGCNQEAFRLLKMLKWMPGIKDGQAVRTMMTLSITFNMADFEKHEYVPANNSNQI